MEADTTFHETVHSTAELDDNAKNFLKYLNFTKVCLNFTAVIFAILCFGFYFSAKGDPTYIQYANYCLLMVLISGIGISNVRANIEMYEFIFKTHHQIRLLVAGSLNFLCSNEYSRIDGQLTAIKMIRNIFNDEP
ncbi:hypothetical protein ACFL35_19190, partial [Candidatus Riflebacteria bacterium]